ncbi:MAG: hypothetical protein SGILL_003315, partial [Bacillariaceae sp.]
MYKAPLTLSNDYIYSDRLESEGGADPMSTHVADQNRELLRSIQETHQRSANAENKIPNTLVATVPDGIEEGMSFVVNSSGRKFLVACPNGAKPGTKLRVPVPSDSINDVVDNLRSMLPFASTSNKKPASSSSQQSQQYKFFDIVVPPGAKPSQLLPVNVYGKRVPVRLPDTVTEGETVTLKIPIQDVVGDIELDYEQVDTSLTGGWNRTIRMEDLKFQWVNSNSYNDNNSSSRSISARQNAVRDIAFVRNLIVLEGNDKRLQTGVVDLVPAGNAVTESEFRLHPLSKPLVTYANVAHHIQSKASLEVKQDWLYKHVLDPLKGYSVQDGTKVKLLVRRSSLLADSVHSVLSLSPKQMRKPWQIEFVGEPALDYGGVMRGACVCACKERSSFVYFRARTSPFHPLLSSSLIEWMQLVSEQIFNPDLGLWLPSFNNQVLMRINPACYVSCPDEYLVYFRFLGRLMGRALFDRQVIQGHMVRHLYKHLLGWPVTFDDLEEQDEEYYDNLKQFTKMDADELAQLYLDFTVTEDVLGTRKIVELVPGGAEKEVNADNLSHFLEAVLRYRMLERNKMPIQELILGFFDVIPEAALTVFDPNELELMLCGLPIIDIEDWQANTVLTGNLDERVVTWFWQI